MLDLSFGPGHCPGELDNGEEELDGGLEGGRGERPG